MTRLNWHAFTMPEVPPFGWEDPFYDRDSDGPRMAETACGLGAEPDQRGAEGNRPNTIPPFLVPECSNEEKTNGNEAKS